MIKGDKKIMVLECNKCREPALGAKSEMGKKCSCGGKFVKNENVNKIFKPIKYVFIGLIVLILTFSSVYMVQAGTRGVLLTWGKPSMNVMDEGIHLKFPIAQSVKKLEVRTQKIETNADSASRDLQDVQTTIALNYHLSPNEVPKLYQEIGMGYKERIIDPAIQESVKAVTAKFTAEELISRRAEVRTSIQETIREKLSKYYLIVDDFNIVNFQFSESFDIAIEQKVTAEQLKLKAEMDLERIKVEAEQTIARAEAEAIALRLQKQEITPDLIKLREIEVQRTAIEKWNGRIIYLFAPLIRGFFYFYFLKREHKYINPLYNIYIRNNIKNG
jgi:regulator of protease activity HflC (stomatin/prohibitin superfamily)